MGIAWSHSKRMHDHFIARISYWVWPGWIFSLPSFDFCDLPCNVSVSLNLCLTLRT
jgi:hypothetical protein